MNKNQTLTRHSKGRMQEAQHFKNFSEWIKIEDSDSANTLNPEIKLNLHTLIITVKLENIEGKRRC